MKGVRFALAGIVLWLPAGAALACPPPPPGWVAPTHEQSLQRSLSGATDIVYGVIVRAAAAAGEPARFKVIHVYRGNRRKGEIIEAPVGWGHPTPACVGMMGAARPKPIGAYGVIAFGAHSPVLAFVSAEDVELMIRRNWIKSARGS